MATDVTLRAFKQRIRTSPCGMCGAIPIIENGERCHPHCIIPRCDGGQYVEGNVVPRCPSCHDVEHGGDGTAPFIGAARAAGRKGGRTSAIKRTVKEKSRYARIAGLKGGPIGGRARMAKLTAQEKHEWAVKGSLAAKAALLKMDPKERYRLRRRAGNASMAKRNAKQRSALARLGGLASAAARRKRNAA